MGVEWGGRNRMGWGEGGGGGLGVLAHSKRSELGLLGLDSCVRLLLCSARGQACGVQSRCIPHDRSGVSDVTQS